MSQTPSRIPSHTPSRTAASSLVIPTLDIPTDAAFESSIRTAARARLHRAHVRHAHAQHGPGARWLHGQGHARRWQRAAAIAAVAAFGAGLLWPVGSVPPGEASASPASRLVRIFSGEVLASLDAPGRRAH